MIKYKESYLIPKRVAEKMSNQHALKTGQAGNGGTTSLSKLAKILKQNSARDQVAKNRQEAAQSYKGLDTTRASKIEMILDFFPPAIKSKVFNFFTHLKGMVKNRATWSDSDRALILDGVRYPHTDMLDIVKYLFGQGSYYGTAVPGVLYRDSYYDTERFSIPRGTLEFYSFISQLTGQKVSFIFGFERERMRALIDYSHSQPNRGLRLDDEDPEGELTDKNAGVWTDTGKGFKELVAKKKKKIFPDSDGSAPATPSPPLAPSTPGSALSLQPVRQIAQAKRRTSLPAGASPAGAAAPARPATPLPAGPTWHLNLPPLPSSSDEEDDDEFEEDMEEDDDEFEEAQTDTDTPSAFPQASVGKVEVPSPAPRVKVEASQSPIASASNGRGTKPIQQPESKKNEKGAASSTNVHKEQQPTFAEQVETPVVRASSRVRNPPKRYADEQY